MKLSIKMILYVLLAVFIVLIVAGMILARKRLIEVQQEIFSIQDNYVKTAGVTAEFLRCKAVIDENVSTLKIIASHDLLREMKRQIDYRFESMSEMLKSHSQVSSLDDKARLEEIRQAFSIYNKTVSELFLYRLGDGKSQLRTIGLVSGDITSEKMEQAVVNAADEAGERLLKFHDYNVDFVAKSTAKARVTIAMNEYIIYFLGVVFLIFGVLIVIIVLRFVYTQVGGEPVSIREITRRITDGDLTYPFPQVTKGIFTSVKILNQTMAEVARNADTIANGDFTVKITPQSQDDQLGNALSKMTKTLIDLQKVTREIARGNYALRLDVKGENDMVSMSINQMSESLEKNEQYNREQSWLKDGINKLNGELSGDKDLEKITSVAISYVARYTEAGRGVIYLYNEDSALLKLINSFAFTERDSLSNEYELGKGVVGQVALEKKPIHLRSLSRDDVHITTGVVSSVPVNTYTFPLMYEGILIGVIELASLLPFTRIQMDFLEQSNPVIASSIYLVLQKAKIEELLAKSRLAQHEAEEKTIQVQEANARLEEQQQQIRQQSEELQQTNSQLEEQQQQLQQQSEELQQSNAQLEEQQQQLLHQADELRQGNEQLRHAKDEIDLKARDLELSNKYKSDFLANMSHELRTPLNSIILLSKMMQKNERGNFSDDDMKRARVIHSAGEELLRLINDILDISKIEAGKTTLMVTEFSTEDLLTDLHHFFSSSAKTKGLQLEIEDKLKKRITSDKDKVAQVLRNFISNALKFTKNGTVTIRAEASGKEDRPVRFIVSDTGIGIAPEKHQMIFEAFQQVDSSISREFGGTGLGLTISQKLATLLHGTIEMTSVPGKGSEFSLLLPEMLVLDDADANEESKNPVSTKARDKRKADLPAEATLNAIEPFVDDRKIIQEGDNVILIVEDDNAFADIVAMVIHNMNMKVLHAVTAEQGLHLVQKYKVNGIILDLVLPDMNGVDFMRRLKSFKDLRHIPVQIMSGHEKNPELMRMGALDFLQKPVDQEQIRDAIQGILNFSQKNPKDLLIVEDDEGHREALIELIKSQDIRIKGVDTEEDATQELKKGIYDAVIIDLGLKSGSGLNICKFARESQIKVPIIVYTGKHLSPEEEKNLKRCADRIIIKTVHSENRLLDELTLFLHQTRRSDAATGPASELTTKQKRLSGKTIMVVDDDIKNVFVLSAALEEHGARVIDAQNGREAIALLEVQGADLVLMDIMMPEMDGYTAIRKIRESEGMRHLPVIALTAKALKEDREKCIAAGADDYLAKPVDYDMLIGLAEAWCQKKY